MYVRWKKRMQTKYKRPTGVYILSAVLVRSERKDGKVKQTFMCHLGTIRENAVNYYWHQHDFWETAAAALDRQARRCDYNSIRDTRLTPEMRQIIEQALENVVPKPTSQGREQAAAELAAIKL